MGVESILAPFVRQAVLYIAAHVENSLFCRVSCGSSGEASGAIEACGVAA